MYIDYLKFLVTILWVSAISFFDSYIKFIGDTIMIKINFKAIN